MSFLTWASIIIIIINTIIIWLMTELVIKQNIISTSYLSRTIALFSSDDDTTTNNQSNAPQVTILISLGLSLGLSLGFVCFAFNLFWTASPEHDVQ